MTDSLRLFFALPCPVPIAQAIVRWRTDQHLPGRPVPAENLHLTLAFLGAQPAERLDTLYQVAESLRSQPFEITLERLHCTPRGLLWLEPAQSPGALLQLADALRAGLTDVAIPFDSQAFRPHLTVFRDGAALPGAAPPAYRWLVDRFALYRSDSVPGGVRYRTLREWPLQ